MLAQNLNVLDMYDAGEIVEILDKVWVVMVVMSGCGASGIDDGDTRCGWMGWVGGGKEANISSLTLTWNVLAPLLPKKGLKAGSLVGSEAPCGRFSPPLRKNPNGRLAKRLSRVRDDHFSKKLGKLRYCSYTSMPLT